MAEALRHVRHALRVQPWWHQPELLTIDPATGAPQDVRFTTSRYVFGMLKVPLLPFLAAHNWVTGGPRKLAGCMTGLAFWGMWVSLLLPVMVYRLQSDGFDPARLNATEAVGPVICMLLACMFGITANADASWQLESTSIDGPALLSAVAGASPMAPSEVGLYLDQGLHHMDAHRLIHPASMLAHHFNGSTVRVRVRIRSNVTRMLRALPSAMHRLLALGTYVTPSLGSGTCVLRA